MVSRTRAELVAAACALALAACAPKAPPAPVAVPAPAATPATPPEDHITLSRTACSGSCPVYTLTVYRSGRVHFRGVADTFLVGEKEWRIDAMFARHLFGEFEKANLAALEPKLPTEVEEFPGVVLELVKDGVTTRRQLGGEGTGELARNVEHEALIKKLATIVDKLTASGRYVETSSKRKAGSCVD